MRFSKALALLAFLWVSPAAAATCFAVGSGQITPVNTAVWASTSGGTPGTCAGTGNVPGAADTAQLDTSSGSYTLNWGGTWTVGVFQQTGGTFDNSVNNHPNT